MVSLRCANFPETLASVTQPEPALGLAIRRARERKRWTQKQLAEAVGASARSVGNWELGHRVPRNRLGALEDVLGIRLGDEPAAAELVPSDDWEASVLTDPDLPADLKYQLIQDSRAARAAYDAARRARRQRRAEAAGQAEQRAAAPYRTG